jgi:hypothetical protein
MDFVLLAFAVPVCIADTSTFVIPNIYTKILFYAALIHLALYGIGQLGNFAIFLVILLVLLIFGTGMGDIKVLVLIMITHDLNPTIFILYVLSVATVHILVIAAFKGVIPLKLPLAPSIFLGLVTYLAAR